ncbi:hypothetical protein AVEN_116771-1 [Araneus ventricosus]|uniref:Uncharacterized protein n=1 Tax=Araneus ventricosus TaxID=182803 RepID=A0A4Y2D889_ARAVE|nr:hypothetical protein AVEN_116771-1 [Araneus ventricosus]
MELRTVRRQLHSKRFAYSFDLYDKLNSHPALALERPVYLNDRQPQLATWVLRSVTKYPLLANAPASPVEEIYFKVRNKEKNKRQGYLGEDRHLTNDNYVHFREYNGRSASLHQSYQ